VRNENVSPFRGAGLLTAVGLFTQLLGFCYRIGLSRLAGAEVMGLYQLIMPVYSVLLSFSAVGLTVAVSTFSARYNALGDWGTVHRVLRKGIGLFLAIILPLGTILVLASDVVSVCFLGDARTQLGIILLVPCVLLTGIENLHKHCFYGIGNVRPPAASETVEQIVRTGAVLGLLMIFLPCSEEETVGLIVTGMIVCEVFSVTTLVILIRKQRGRILDQICGEQVRGKDLLAVAIPVGCTSLLGTLMGSANSVLVPQQLVRGGADPSEALSAFGVMCGMTMPMLSLPMGLISALGLTMTPGLARQKALGLWKDIRETLSKAVKIVSLLMAPAMALLSVIGPDIGKALYKNESVGKFIFPLAMGTMLNCWGAICAGALNGLGYQRKAARTAIFCDGIHLGFTIFTVPIWGLRGFVIGFLLSSAVGVIADLRALCSIIKMKILWREWFLAPVTAAVLAGLWENLLFQYLTDHGMDHGTTCVIVAVFGIILYVAGLQAQGIGIKRKSAAE